jgi:colanic acid/amylovoran biosynthesis glycosyltransferase
MNTYNLCIIKPNKDAFSETFIQEHINRLAGNKTVLYGGAFPVYDNEGNYLIRSKLGLLSYLIQKRVFKKKRISVRTNALVKYFRAQKTDVVLAEYGMVGAMVTEACQLANVPLIIHFHGADVHHRATVSAYIDLYKKAFKYASYLVAVSNDMVEALKQLGAPADKIIKAPCGVDTIAFPQIEIRNTGPAFLSVGRFVEKKSPGSIIKAFKLVSQKFPDAKLTMVGQGPLFEEAKNLINELGLNESITLTGILKSAQIKELMAASLCFVQHSVTAESGDKEGTPVTILEAASSGLAIVSTLHAGIKEAVINGETGYLVPEHDIEGMAEKMMIFAADPVLAEQFGKAGRMYMLKSYDIHYSITILNKALSGAADHN